MEILKLTNPTIEYEMQRIQETVGDKQSVSHINA